jgi:hypothetical protein
MIRKKRASRRKGRKEAVSVLGAVGVSFSLASGASDASKMPTLDNVRPQITLTEEEISDVSLGTFFVFDKERTPRGEQYARYTPRACRPGWGCRRAGCGRSCACCTSWGRCRIC